MEIMKTSTQGYYSVRYMVKQQVGKTSTKAEKHRVKFLTFNWGQWNQSVGTDINIFA